MEEDSYEYYYSSEDYDFDIPNDLPTEEGQIPYSRTHLVLPQIDPRIRTPSPPTITAPEDDQVHFSTSLNSSATTIQNVLKIPPTRLSKDRPPGLIILRLEDFCMIRRPASNHHKEVPHIIVFPKHENFVTDHPDFTSCMDAFYPRSQ